MGFFDSNKKKSDPVRVLSETEIQSKLYGDLRKPHTLEKNSAKSAVAPAASQPAADSRGKSADLFTPNTAGVKSAGITPVKSGVDSWMRQESDALNRHMSKPASADYQPNTSKNVHSGGQEKSSILFTIFKTVGFVVAAGLAQFIQLLSSVFRPNHQKIRQALPVVGAILFVTLLVMGIHSLNISREKAMRSGAHNVKKKLLTATDSPTDKKQAVDNRHVSAVVDHKSVKAAESSAQMKKSEVSNSPVESSAEQVGVVKPYVIQVATYVNLSDAEAMLQKIQGASMTGFIQSLKRQSGRVYHCVFVGRFKSVEDAEKTLAQFKKKDFAQAFPDAFIRSLK